MSVRITVLEIYVNGTGRDHTNFTLSFDIMLLLWILTFTRYLPPYTPHMGPLDPVTFKEATLFTCILLLLLKRQMVSPVSLIREAAVELLGLQGWLGPDPHSQFFIQLTPL